MIGAREMRDGRVEPAGIASGWRITSVVNSVAVRLPVATITPPLRATRVLAVNAAAWGAVVLLHTAASYGDALRRGAAPGVASLLSSLALAYLPWLAFSVVLSLLLARDPTRVTDARAMRHRFFWSIPLFLLPQVGYQVMLAWGTQPEREPYLQALRRWPAVLWLIDLALFSATFAVVYATFAVLESLASQKRRERADAELRTVQHELDQQRLQGLRAQLEPHFLFNTLNAISGLVRGDDRALAVKALGELSALLRYALSSTQRDWVTMGDELAFVDQYLALQRLRYGDRLMVERTVQAASADADCPPLLLQPLVENAIRHDLERHEGASDIRLRVATDGPTVQVEVSNTLRAAAPPNPGLGLGLAATRDRLQLLYGERARFTAGAAGDRFVVTLRLPVEARD